MQALRDDPAERSRLGEAARGAASGYDPRVLGARLERAYEDLLARH
jgi:hypothetical protein